MSKCISQRYKCCFIQDGPWVAIEEGYTIDKVVGMFGSELTKEEIEILEDNMTYFYDGTETKQKKLHLYPGSKVMKDLNLVTIWFVVGRSFINLQERFISRQVLIHIKKELISDIL